MFTRLRRTVEILTHREIPAEPHFTPEIEFVEPHKHSSISYRIASLCGFALAISIVAICVRLTVIPLAERYSTASVFTVAGVIGALIFWATEHALQGVRRFLAHRFGISLTPHVGHKLEETLRILRG